MNLTKDDEDYWQSTEKRFFSFDSNEVDRILETSNYATDTLCGNVSSMSMSQSYLKSNNDLQVLKPLLSVISEKTLSCILAVDKVPNVDQESNNIKPDITLKKILLGQPYSLEPYKSLASKTALLDAAIASGNGNAILIVVLFLTKTLKKSLVYRLLSERPEAVNVYIHYLSIRLQTNEITDILTMLGQSLNSAMINLHIILKNTQDCDTLLQKLRSCYKTQFLNLIDCKETKFLQSYIQLLEWQIVMKTAEPTGEIETNSSVLDCLRYICKNDKHPAGDSLTSAMFSQQHDISPKQYQKILIEVKASLGEWEAFDRILLTKGWLGNKKLQTPLLIGDILKLLHKAQAPLNVLEKYLKYVDNIEKRLELAKSFHCYRIAIDIYVAQGDRTALLEYKSKLQPQSEQYFYAESALRLPSVKWKN